MAESGQQSGDLTVLRIKRKRTDDPLNTLVVHNWSTKKKKEYEDDSSSPSDGKNLFCYSGTVDETNMEATKHVVKNFQTIYNNVRHQGVVDENKLRRRQVHQNHQKLARYRVITGKRQSLECDNEISSSEENELENIYRVYDVVAEDHIEASEQKATTEDTVLCNAVQMIRENLHINENIIPEESEYVYDLFAYKGAFPAIDNEIIDIEEYHDGMLLHDTEIARDDEEVYDDEDDENAEDNWRNDYPDEDYYSTEDDEKDGDSSGSSSGDEDHVYNRYRHGHGRLQFDPYAEYRADEYCYTISDGDSDNDT